MRQSRHDQPTARGTLTVHALTLTGWLLTTLTAFSQPSPILHVELKAGVPHLASGAIPGQLLLLERSTNLTDWTEIARVTAQLQSYGDWSPAGDRFRFYRARVRPTEPSDDWANLVGVASDFLFKPGSGSGLAGMASMKWTALLSQPDRVYFQDSVRYPFHIQFARARLPGYASMGTLDFDLQALFANASQRMVLGSLLRSPDPRIRELGIEVTGSEPFPAGEVVDWIEAVKRRVVLPPGWRIFYMPSTEQRAETESHLPLFSARGLEVSSLERWATANSCYSDGWALGRLVRVPSTEIQAALGDGRLGFGDILVTDRVPSELPALAGYLCLEPATPNSHVALLARSQLLPFAFANGAGLRAEIASLVGREVLLIAEETNGVCQISLRDTTDLLTADRRQQILDSKRSRELGIVPKAHRGALVLPVDDLTPADLKYVGGKAANFGFLRRSLPTESPHPARALTFDLWDAYLDQLLPDGVTLREFIDARLSRHRFPPDIARLRADLAEIQNAVGDRADFTPGPRALLVASLRDAGLRGAGIRFRSSTNVEDGEGFNGAGLLDSFSGCLEDDTDNDSTGPSRCDPSEPKERGVFRAIRKVYASFYNENAFLERLRHGVNEAEVGTGLLVHFSVPDANEMANGVATLAVDRSTNRRFVQAQVVSQLGAESVTNPDVTIRPEVATAMFTNNDIAAAILSLEERSTLTKDAAPVMDWPVDYRTLLQQLNTVALAYEAYYPAKTTYELDCEFKRVSPGLVGLKQVRPVPHPTPIPPPTIP